jgi:hypothetical protein
VLSERACKSWNRYLERFRFKEAAQPLHTFFRIADTLKFSRSARLDTFFHSLDETDRQLYQPVSFVPHVPHSLLTAYCAFGEKDEIDAGDMVRSLAAAKHLFPAVGDESEDDDDWEEGDTLLRRCRPSSDHLPISLTFVSTSPNSTSPNTSVPGWVLKDPCFLRMFQSAWHPNPSLPPFELLALFKTTVFTVALAVRATKKA